MKKTVSVELSFKSFLGQNLKKNADFRHLLRLTVSVLLSGATESLAVQAPCGDNLLCKRLAAMTNSARSNLGCP